MKLNHFAYPAKFEKEDGFTLISFRDLPFALTSADKTTRPMWQAMDCLDEAIATLIDDGIEIPDPSRARADETMVPVPAITAAKAILVEAMRDQKVTVAKLAKALVKDPKDVRRIIDPRHPTKMATITEALGEVGIVSTLSFTKPPTAKMTTTQAATRVMQKLQGRDATSGRFVVAGAKRRKASKVRGRTTTKRRDTA